MIASAEHKIYQKMLKKGQGSILRSIRIDKGGGKGLIAGAIVILIFTLPLTLLGIVGGLGVIGSVLLSVPGLLMLVFGIVLKRKRENSWISYYQETTGYSEGELMQIDRELASPSVTLVLCRTTGAATDNYITCFLTEHYMVMNGVSPYVRRLDEIIAVAFSDSTDIWCMVCLTLRDEETMSVGLFTDTWRKEALCKEIMQELCHRNPKILCGQEIVCDGKRYILERDGAELLRLHREGHTLDNFSLQ